MLVVTTGVNAPSSSTGALGWRVFRATSLGWIWGIVFGVLLVVLAETLGHQGLQTPLVLGFGFGVGTQQYLALRQIMPGRRTHWIGGTCLGFAAPFLVLDLAALAGPALPFSLIPFVGLGGVLAGVLQWRILQAEVGGAAAWLFAAPLGCLAAMSTVWLNESVIPRVPGVWGALGYLAVIFVGGLIYGTATGWAANRLKIAVPPASEPRD